MTQKVLVNVVLEPGFQGPSGLLSLGSDSFPNEMCEHIGALFREVPTRWGRQFAEVVRASRPICLLGVADWHCWDF